MKHLSIYLKIVLLINLSLFNKGTRGQVRYFQNIKFEIHTSYYDTSSFYKNENGKTAKARLEENITSSKDQVSKTVRDFGFGSIEKKSIPFGKFKGDLYRVNFIGGIEFLNHNIENKALFNFAKFSDKVFIAVTQFLDTASFVGTEFLDDVEFNDVKFTNLVDFRSSVFSKKTRFQTIIFQNGTSFSPLNMSIESYRNTQITFSPPYYVSIPTKFLDGVSFLGVTFSKDLDFDNTIFTKYVDFSTSIFLGNLSFYKIILPPRVAFNDAELPENIYFKNVIFDSLRTPYFLYYGRVNHIRKVSNNANLRCKVYFMNTDISNIVLDASKFELGFAPSAEYDRKVGMLQQLIKNCKDLGLETNVQGFDIDLKILQLKHRFGFFSPALIWLNTYWYNFGYERTKIFKNISVAFGLSFLIFFLFLQYFTKVYLPPQMGFQQEEAIKLNLFKRQDIATRFKVSLFYAALIFFSLKMDHDEVKYRRHPWGAACIYLIFSIGIIHLAYLASVVISN